jgi:hypothetical protein
MPDLVRIAIIDSGVHPDHPHIDAGRLLPGFSIAKDGAISELDSLDALGHGTAVTAAIQDQATDALCLPIRVFHDTLRTTARALVTAIDRAVVARVDLINLSLGTTNPAHHNLFAAAADRAREAGILIVAAREAEGTPCYPGSLNQVLGVSLDWDCPRDQYRVRDSEVDASGHPRPIPGVEQRRNLYGVSFAVANMSGILARGGGEEVAHFRDRVMANATTRSILQK